MSLRYESGPPLKQQAPQYKIQANWWVGATWTIRFVWTLGIGWAIMFFGIAIDGATGHPLVESLWLTPNDVLHGKIWELVTAPWFPSVGWWRGPFQVFYLLAFGPKLERDLGSKKFLRFYLTVAYVSTIAAFLFSFLSPSLSTAAVSTAGAAVFAVAIAYMLVYPKDVFLFFAVFPVQVVYIIAIILFLEFLPLVFNIGSGTGCELFAELAGIGLAWATIKISSVRALTMGDPLMKKGPRVPKGMRASMANAKLKVEVKPQVDANKVLKTSDKPAESSKAKGKDRSKFLEL